VNVHDEEEARLGRLFNILMVISTGTVVALTAVFLSMRPLGLLNMTEICVAAAFPLAFIPFSLFCLLQSRRGRVLRMITVYSWVNLAAIAIAAWLFDGIYSPAWLLFIWTITVAGTLLAPAYALWMTAGVVAYFAALLLATRWGLYSPPLTLGVAGREFVQMAALLIMLIASVGLLTYLNMRSLREALENLRQEIAGRERTEESLRQSEEQFRSIFEHVDDVICTVDADGKFATASPSAERMLGWKPGDWIGRPFAFIVHPDDLPRMEDLFRQAQAGRSLPAFQVRVLTKAGGYLEAEVVATPIRRGDDVIIHAVCVTSPSGSGWKRKIAN
jgi:PAS domain S-box-containing protein